MKIATVAALAFGTLASAIPSPVASAETRDLETRSGQTVTSILTALPTQLSGPVGQLKALTSTTATPANVATIANQVAGVVSNCVSDIHGAGSLGDGDLLSLLTVSLTVVLEAFIFVCGLPGVDVVNIKIAIVVAVDVILADLISVVLNLVLGLLGLLLEIVIGLLVSLLGSVVVNIFIEINLTACISILGI